MDITITIKAPELASAIKALAEAIGWQTASAITQAIVNDTTPAPVPDSMDLVPPEPGPVIEAAAEAPTLTMEDLRAKATKLAKSGKSAAIKATLAEFGTEAVSKLKPEQFAAFDAALGKL